MLYILNVKRIEWDLKQQITSHLPVSLSPFFFLVSSTCRMQPAAPFNQPWPIMHPERTKAYKHLSSFPQHYTLVHWQALFSSPSLLPIHCSPPPPSLVAHFHGNISFLWMAWQRQIVSWPRTGETKVHMWRQEGDLPTILHRIQLHATV